MYKITFFLPIILFIFSLKASQEIKLLSNDIPPNKINETFACKLKSLQEDDLTEIFPPEIMEKIFSYCDYNTKKNCLYLNKYYNEIIDQLRCSEFISQYLENNDFKIMTCIYNTIKKTSPPETLYFSREQLFRCRFEFILNYLQKKNSVHELLDAVSSQDRFERYNYQDYKLFFKNKYNLMNCFTTFIYNALKENLNINLPFNIITSCNTRNEKFISNCTVKQSATLFWYHFFKKISTDSNFYLNTELITFINYFFTIISLYDTNHFICYKKNKKMPPHTEKTAFYCRNKFKNNFKNFNYKTIINICNYFLEKQYKIMNENEDNSIILDKLHNKVRYFCLLFIRTNPLPFLKNSVYYKKALNPDIYYDCFKNALFGLYDLFSFNLLPDDFLAKVKRFFYTDQNLKYSSFPDCKECSNQGGRHHSIEDINDMDLDWNKKCILGHNNENYIAKLKKFNKQNNISLPHNFSKQLQNITIPNDDIDAIYFEREMHDQDVPLSIKTIYNKLYLQKKSSLFSKKTICFTSFFISILLYSIYVYFDKNSSFIKTTSSIDMQK